MTSWLRRNRWGLLALPVAVALAVGANAQRLQDYWWDQDLRQPAATGRLDEWVTWTDSFSDATGESTRTLRVKVTGVAATDLELPSDLVGERVALDFAAEPDQVLSGCRLALLDGDGNRYVYDPTINEVSQDIWPCVPGNHPGPAPSIAAGQPRTVAPGEERPPSWTAQPVLVVPRNAKITQVLLWWEEPEYLAVQLN
ncbi:MAG: hypothetical protein ACRDUX_33230 [Mycobacterium sp.]